jgi:hypothetical protein
MYSPQYACYGIDELRDYDGFTTGFSHTAASFEDAFEILLGLLREATFSK